MSFTGSGTFVINSAGQPVVSGTVISSTAFNALTADLATGLSTCITKDGQTTPTANIPMGNNKITNLAVGTAASDAATLSQAQSTAAKLINSVSGADTVTGVLSPTLGAYAAGQMFYWVAAGDNTGPVTLNIDGLGAKAVTRDGSVALDAGDIKSGEVVVVVYDGTRFQVVSQINSGGDARFANVSITSALNVGGVATFTGGTANGVTYLNGSKVLTSGTALVFDGTNLGIGTTSPGARLEISTTGIPIKTGGPGSGSVLQDIYVTRTSSGTAIQTGPNITFEDGTANNSITVQNSQGNLTFWNYGAGAWNERMRLDSSGNLGLGVTPSAWNSGWKAFEITGAGSGIAGNGSNRVQIGTNHYLNSSSQWIYSTTAAATQYTQISGQHQWFTAPSGTAGNAITFTQAMTLDASGDLLVGTTNASAWSTAGRGLVEVNGSSTALIGLKTGDTQRGYVYSQGTDLIVQAVTGVLTLNGTGGSGASVDSSGNLSVGAVLAENSVGAYLLPSGEMRVKDSTEDGTSQISIYNTNTSADAEQFFAAMNSSDVDMGNRRSGALKLFTNNIERARIDSSGDLLVGTTSSNGRLTTKGSGTGSSTYSLACQNSSGTNHFLVRDDGFLIAEQTYNNTNASAANMYISSGGAIYRSTSSLKYKKDVQNAVHGLAELMTLRPVTYKGVNNGAQVFGGLIAEEVHDAGLTEFVQYADDGSPDALAYGNMVSLAIKAIQEQQAMIDDLKAKVAALESA